MHRGSHLVWPPCASPDKEEHSWMPFSCSVIFRQISLWCADMGFRGAAAIPVRGWSYPRAALSKPEVQSPRIFNCAGVLRAPCAPHWQRNMIPPSSHCCWNSCGLECCFPILNKNLHLWELISLFRVCSWTVNRLWSPNLSSEESRVGLFPWARSGSSGTPQQELSWAGSGVQVWKGRFIFFLSLNFGKQNRRLKVCKTSSLLPNCFLKCP